MGGGEAAHTATAQFVQFSSKEVSKDSKPLDAMASAIFAFRLFLSETVFPLLESGLGAGVYATSEDVRVGVNCRSRGLGVNGAPRRHAAQSMEGARFPGLSSVSGVHGTLRLNAQ